MSHVSGDLVRRYVNGDRDIPADQVWALEAHLETCAACRELLASNTESLSPLLDTVWAGLETAEPPARHRRIPTWAAPAGLPWAGMALLVMAIAMLLDLLNATNVPLVMLLAPVAPVLGVTAVWNKAMDPAYELVSATPRAGLYLALRRTAAVLLLVIPVLVLAGLPSGTSPGLWLLPCLAFTFGTLALGSLISLSRAAVVLAGSWAAFVVGPSLISGDVPNVLQPASSPIWALIVAGCVAVMAVRADMYARLR
ncbi:MAG: zf-HC2 domain-containing protein [Kibdelosporangium sp.]